MDIPSWQCDQNGDSDNCSVDAYAVGRVCYCSVPDMSLKEEGSVTVLEVDRAEVDCAES